MVIGRRFRSEKKFHAALVNGMVTSIAERTHCEHPRRPAFRPWTQNSLWAIKSNNHPPDKFVGTVKAVFTTKEGETRYAVGVEGHGTLRLCSDHTIVPH
jgi:hypothetical protein